MPGFDPSGKAPVAVMNDSGWQQSGTDQYSHTSVRVDKHELRKTSSCRLETKPFTWILHATSLNLRGDGTGTGTEEVPWHSKDM